MNKGFKLTGGYSILRVWPKGLPWVGSPIYKSRVHNLVVTVGKNHVADWFIGEITTPFTYHAIGTDDTAPSVGDVIMGSEEARKVFSNRSRSGSEVTLSCYYTAAECTYAIEECGIFGGAAASAGAESGIMLCHYLQSYDNSAGTYDLTFDYVFEIT